MQSRDSCMEPMETHLSKSSSMLCMEVKARRTDDTRNYFCFVYVFYVTVSFSLVMYDSSLFFVELSSYGTIRSPHFPGGTRG